MSETTVYHVTFFFYFPFLCFCKVGIKVKVEDVWELSRWKELTTSLITTWNTRLFGFKGKVIEKVCERSHSLKHGIPPCLSKHNDPRIRHITIRHISRPKVEFSRLLCEPDGSQMIYREKKTSADSTIIQTFIVTTHTLTLTQTHLINEPKIQQLLRFLLF